MTREETIKLLDSLTVYLNGCLLHNYSLNSIKTHILQSLRKVIVSTATLQSIENIEIEEHSRNDLKCQFYGSKECERMDKEAYKDAIQSMLNILRSEREAQMLAMQREVQKVNLIQQKRSNRIQIWALVFTIATLVATLVMLVKSFIN